VKILYVQYANPGAYPPLQHSARILADDGAKVLLLGIVTTGTEALEFPTHKNIEVQEMKSCAPGFRQKIQYLLFCLWVAWAALSWRPKWLYASDLLASPIAWLLTFWPGFDVVYHEHDTPAQVNANTPAATRFMRAILWTRRRVARRARFCVLPNEKRVEAFRAQTQTNRPLYCVWNCPSRLEAAAVTSHISSEQLTVFYHGSIVPDRLSLNVVRALAELPPAVSLEFAGYETIGHEGYIREILAEAKRIGVLDRVKYIGALPRAELLPRCSQAQVGLSVFSRDSQDLSMASMVGASNKPFDYLLCRLALLVSDLPDWNRAFVEPGFGLSCSPEDPQSLAAALQWFVDHPQQKKEMGEKGRQRILEDWNYEAQFEKVRGLIECEQSQESAEGWS
jgi:glycosyltransferase involved in cell wall biosynthesis